MFQLRCPKPKKPLNNFKDVLKKEFSARKPCAFEACNMKYWSNYCKLEETNLMNTVEIVNLFSFS